MYNRRPKAFRDRHSGKRRSQLECDQRSRMAFRVTQGINQHIRQTEQAEQTALAGALIKIVRIRYDAFRERFGRDPKPDEPLLFESAEVEPASADTNHQILQVISAAVLAQVDAAPILDLLGLVQIGSSARDGFAQTHRRRP